MFERCHEFTAKWEGGLSDVKEDRGGITNYGVSLVFLQGVAREYPGLVKALGIMTPVNAETIRRLTPKQAKGLFRYEFWDKPGFGDFPEPLALVCYDCAVNSDVARSVRLLQEALNKHGAKLQVDGAVGPKTRAAVAQLPRGWVTPAALLHVELREGFYKKLASANASQKVFLAGWLNRTKDLKRALNKFM